MISKFCMEASASGKFNRKEYMRGTVNFPKKHIFSMEGSIPLESGEPLVWRAEDQYVKILMPEKLFKIQQPNVSPKYPTGVELYSPGRISLGRTAELLGKAYDDLLDEIKEKGLNLDFGPETREEAFRELASIRRHHRSRR